jgi:hypothetical protein
MKWNPFKKKTPTDPKEEERRAADAEKFLNAPGMPKMEDLNIAQRFMMRRLIKMSPEERRKVMEKMITPKNIEKNKDDILKELNTLKKAGQISDDQYRLAKARLGLK